MVDTRRGASLYALRRGGGSNRNPEGGDIPGILVHAEREAMDRRPTLSLQQKLEDRRILPTTCTPRKETCALSKLQNHQHYQPS